MLRGVTRSRRFRGLARLSGRSWSVLVTPSVAQGDGRTSALGDGQDTPAHSDGVAVGEGGRELGEDQEVRLRLSAEAECAPKNRSTANYLGGGWGQVCACADRSPRGGLKRSANGLPIGLRAARSPPRKSAGAARRPSRGASFSEARTVRERSRIPGKKSGSTNSRNLKIKNKKENKICDRCGRHSVQEETKILKYVRTNLLIHIIYILTISVLSSSSSLKLLK